MVKRIDGKAIANQLYRDMSREITDLKTVHKICPKLGVILVGDNPASKMYVNMKKKNGQVCEGSLCSWARSPAIP
ncbi:MAG: tetrahydrofolate dehydrogenase/cyclohydrolase catalytic domain-containing protein, partial [Candidatus Hodarchaeota archaeon]